MLAATAGFVVYFIGVFSGGLDIGETCARLGQPYDDAYRATHWEEPSRFFPLHNRCNAAFDVVPAWVNPALVCFAALTVIGAVVAVVMGTARIVAAVRRSPARIK
ncbi:hypothetical protein [Actinopolymorpha alba]|uniref:hypothetical protein n=1 Tax=Actinopolymorpha alba TaxID=533267 RepID=UPI0012F62C38|nr:hypothetical protein [Actinopolymorpha alba]